MQGFFRVIGWVLVIAGLAAVASALTSDVTVYNEGRFLPYAGYIEPTQTVNFHKMFSALSMLLAGGLSVVAGAVFAVGAEAVASRRSNAPRATAISGDPSLPSGGVRSEPPILRPGDKSGALMGAGVIALGIVIVVIALNFPSKDPSPAPAASAASPAVDAALPGSDVAAGDAAPAQ